jgi:hypothetical protein
MRTVKLHPINTQLKLFSHHCHCCDHFLNGVLDALARPCLHFGRRLLLAELLGLFNVTATVLEEARSRIPKNKMNNMKRTYIYLV